MIKINQTIQGLRIVNFHLKSQYLTNQKKIREIKHKQGSKVFNKNKNFHTVSINKEPIDKAYKNRQ